MNLKIPVLFFGLLMVCTHVGLAQTQQKGVVKEYNERLGKTPLGDVEIVISNASSTASGQDGNFLLQFRTLKPGDKVNVRRIEKLGYEIFNKEALQQWFIARDGTPFTIVMCKSEKFKKIRDNYSRVSSESYERQMKKEEARLAAEHKAGKLKEEEYKAALQKLNNDYDRQLDNLDNYVDRFARIDLSELSSVEAEIISLVQKGEIDRAIQLYEAQHLEEKYKQQVAAGQKAQAAIDTLTVVREKSLKATQELYASIRRKNETLRLAGGRENFEKIGKSLKEIVLADTTNLEAVWEYAQFAQKQADFYDAERFYRMLIAATRDDQQRVEAMMRLSDTYRMLKRFADSQQWGEKALALARKLNDSNPDAYQLLLAQVVVGLGILNYELNQLTEAEQLITEGSVIYARLSEDGSDIHLQKLCRVQNNLSNLYKRMRQFDKAMDQAMRALDNVRKLYEMNPKKYLYDMAYIHQNAGTMSKTLNKMDDCETYFKQSIGYMEQLYRFNPKAYRDEYFRYVSNLGVFYKAVKRYDEAEACYVKALALADTLYAGNRESYAVYMGNTLLNMGNLYHTMKRLDDSRRYLVKAYPILQQLYERSKKAFTVNFFSVNMSMGNVSMEQKKTSEAIPYFMKAKELGEQLVAANPKAFSLEYCLILKNLATAYDDSGNPTQAEAYARDVLTRIEKLYHDNPSSFEYKTEYESVVRIAKKLGLPVNELPAAGS